jgi:hypothetical protein
MTAARFPCTPGGAVARGRRRLRLLLLGLAALMVAVGAAAAATDRIGAGIWAWLAALLPLLAWRMSSDVELLWLELQPGTLTVRMRWRRERLPLAGATARRLTPEEAAHLERLATAGGVVASIGGFESHLLGELDLYASDLSHAVLIELPDQRLVVTPDDPNAFLAALSRSATA